MREDAVPEGEIVIETKDKHGIKSQKVSVGRRSGFFRQKSLVGESRV